MNTLIPQAPDSTGPSIHKLKERHHEIKRRLIAGDLATDIAKSMGVSDAWMSIIISSPPFVAELEKARALADANAADIGKRLTALAPDAMDIIEQAIRKKEFRDRFSPMQQVTNAKDVLDRVGHGKPTAQAQQPVAVKIEIVNFTVAPKPQTVIDAKVVQGE